MKEELSTIITFKIDDSLFAFDALKVRHILELSKLTHMPNTAKFLIGLINLHGNIIPIADLRMLLGQQNLQNTKDTSVIVISPNGMLESYLGLVVDMVQEVIPISSDKIKPSLIEGSIGMIDTFIGTVHLNNEFINIINLDDLVEKVEKAK
ncbi:MAG: chemotaxis protein CheW [Breznakibacter sp.]